MHVLPSLVSSYRPEDLLAKLSSLTRQESVRRALDEYQRVGRQAFLDRYGFATSRDYFIQESGELYDSKPVVAAAFGFEHPELGPLRSSDFSGGMSGAVRALNRLGFDVVTSAQLRPPRLGDEYESRTAIQDAYGGQRVQGIIRFPGDATVNAFSDEEGPYADEPPSLSDDFGYRGEGLSGPQSLTSPGNKLLEDARKSGSAVRFWYRPDGGDFRFWCWVAVLGRAWVVGTDDKKAERQEIEWRFIAVPGPDPDEWAPDIREARNRGELEDDPEAEPAAQIAVTYSALCDRVGAPRPPQRSERSVRWEFQRSATARRAVLLRCAGQCESPFCTGMPARPARNGSPLLEVDHVNDLGRGGDDHPSNMIALCPNCHAVKTRGSGTSAMRRELAKLAAHLHAQSMRSQS